MHVPNTFPSEDVDMSTFQLGPSFSTTSSTMPPPFDPLYNSSGDGGQGIDIEAPRAQLSWQVEQPANLGTCSIEPGVDPDQAGIGSYTGTAATVTTASTTTTSGVETSALLPPLERWSHHRENEDVHRTAAKSVRTPKKIVHELNFDAATVSCWCCQTTARIAPLGSHQNPAARLHPAPIPRRRHPDHEIPRRLSPPLL
jgi:hypothetical protein